MNKEAERAWFEKILDETGNIMRISWELGSLASAFMRTGNMSMSETLYAVAEELRTSQKTISEAVGEHSNEDYKQAVQASNNVVLTALAMCKVIPKEEAAKRIK